MPRRTRLDKRRPFLGVVLLVSTSLFLLFALTGCKRVRAPNTVLGLGGVASLSRSNIPEAQERSAGGVAFIGTIADVKKRDNMAGYADVRAVLGGGDGGFAGLFELQAEFGPTFGDEHRFGLRGGAGVLFQSQADAAAYRIQLPTVFAGWIYHPQEVERPYHLEAGLRSSLNLFTRERDELTVHNHGVSLDVGLGVMAMGNLFALQAEYLYTIDTTPIHTLHVRGCIGTLAFFCLDARHDRIQVAEGSTPRISTVQLYFMLGDVSGISTHLL